MTDPSRPRPTRRRFLVIPSLTALVVVAMIGVGALLGSRLGTDPTLVDSPLIGAPAPTPALPALETGEPVALPALRGQVVVVNFWASWCVPCRQEHPALLAAANAYRPAGVTFVGVSFQDRPADSIRFLDELGRAPDYRYVLDPDTRAAVEFGVFGIPETFVIDRTGTIVAKITGPAGYPLLARVLDDVLAGRRPPSTTAGPTSPAPAAPGATG